MMNHPVIDMRSLNLKEQRVLIRVDYNVPVEEGRVTSDQRIRATLPTIEYCLKQGASVILMSHLGRPKEGLFDPEFSLQPVALCLSELLHYPVSLQRDWLQGIDLHPGTIVLCENVRFEVGENEDAAPLAQKMAALCDIFVMDAFGTAHRAQASTHGVAQFAPIACAGPLLMRELESIEKVLEHPRRPLVAVVGGSKVSSKLKLLETLSHRVDQLIVGGGIANTFLVAAGQSVGASLYEAELVDKAKEIMAKVHQEGGIIPLPTDVIVAKTFASTAEPLQKKVAEVETDDQILDIGPESIARLQEILKRAGTILWNGPVGVFEWDAFTQGTKKIAEAIAHSAAFSAAGGGDTLAAIEKYHLESEISYISTGGGAFLTLVEGSPLPGVEVLKQRARTKH